MSMIPAGEPWWVATFDNGTGLRADSDPYPAHDRLAAWAKARHLRVERYGDDGWTVTVKPHTPVLDIVNRSRP